MVEAPDGGSYLVDVGDGFIVCVRKGQTLTEQDKEAIREFRDFLRMSPAEQKAYIAKHDQEGEDG